MSDNSRCPLCNSMLGRDTVMDYRRAMQIMIVHCTNPKCTPIKENVNGQVVKRGLEAHDYIINTASEAMDEEEAVLRDEYCRRAMELKKSETESDKEYVIGMASGK